MRFLSLFSGIGGLDLGLERAGMTCVAQVEIDPFCRRVLAKHWPDVPRFEDVRTVTREQLPEGIDLIAGGFPCVDISNAGASAGIEAPRSGLWKHFYRLICEIRPLFAIVENVAALLERGVGTVLADVAECGFDAEWRTFRASQFGAPHIRDRLFILCHRRDGNAALPETRNILADAGSESRWIQQPFGRQNPAELLAIGADVARRGNVGIYQSGEAFTGVNPWENESSFRRVGNGFPDWMDRRERLGNAVVPQVAEWIGRRILAAESSPSAPRVKAATEGTR